MANELFFPLLIAMTLAAYALRAGGFFMMRFVPITPRLDAALRATPLGVMAGIVTVAALNGGLAEWIATVLVLIIARITGQDIVAALLGVVAVGVLRWWGI